MTESPLISVILCAHNPRPAHFQATLEGLRAQDLPFSDWELLVIDNLSTAPLAARFDLSWHPRARVVLETNLGLAHARRRGYSEAQGRLIVHSDDDNILNPGYLRTAWELHQRFPYVGSFGGAIEPRFDRAPLNELERSFGQPRVVPADVWSHIIDDNRTMPWGAGMCVRRDVIDAYLTAVARDPRRLILGRTGNRFITGEDIDLNYVAVRCGYATGLFRALHLVHLIPVERMTDAHIVRYRAGNAYSMVILWFLHTGEMPVPQASLAAQAFFWVRLWTRMTPHQRRVELAMRRARREARADMQQWGWLPPS